MTDYRKIIEVDQAVRFGKACIKGTRISVHDVLSWFASGMTEADVLKDYPELTAEQIQACLSYAADRERKIRVARH